MEILFDFFSPPVFPNDEEKTRSAYYVNATTLSSMFVLALLLIVRISSGDGTSSNATRIVMGMILALGIIFVLEKNNYVKPASYLLIITLWAATSGLAINGNGIKDIGAISYLVVIALAGLILGYRAGLWLTALSAASIALLAYAETQGMITYDNEPIFNAALELTVLLVINAIFIYLTIHSLQAAIKQAKEKSNDLEKSNHELLKLQGSLEDKVKERTNNLLKANNENKRRAAQFQTVTQITQKIASERDLDTLLSIITEVISTQFNYYHVAIYLNDDRQEYTILSATNSEKGEHMLERGHKLQIGQTGMVGYVAKTGSFRLAMDIKADAMYYGADLVETRSELTLPLRAGNQITGVLDVQSKETNAFDQADVEALNALANQIMIAIQNTRLFAETQTALAESQLLYGTVVKQTWKANVQTNPQIGYRYTGVKPVPLTKEVFTPEISEALENGDIAVTHPSRRKDGNALAVPLKLRESTIGVINIKLPTDTEIGEDEIDIVRAASQHIAIALENASLLEESQRRAKREQTISEMSGKISSGTEIETILKTAIRELGAQIGGAQISIEIGSENE